VGVVRVASRKQVISRERALKGFSGSLMANISGLACGESLICLYSAALIRSRSGTRGTSLHRQPTRVPPFHPCWPRPPVLAASWGWCINVSRF
jgi:hypothetical protein